MYKNACPACKNACLLICIFGHLFVLLQYVKTYTEHLTKQDNPMTHIALNMIQTAGLGALALIVGMAMTRRVTLLQRFCVPSPVSGGIVFALITLALHVWFHTELSFDDTLQEVFMLAFFTSVGFQSDLKAIRQGGKLLTVMLALLVTLIVLQNLMPQTIIRLMGTDRLLDMDRIVSVGNICLSMFLGMAMISLKLWELQTLALPLLVILLTQVLLMGVFVYWVAFPLLGRDYDAAVLCAGMCGFGLGATPNAMANMSAVCYKYRYSVKPFLIVPIIGAMFADLINTGIITLFLNVI